MESHATNSRQLEQLRELIARVECRHRPSDDEVISSGCTPLDALLPEKGLRRGALIEWLATEGAGATTLALLAAREACRDGGALVVLDHSREFYPPVAARMGIDLERLIIVRAGGVADNTWALDQALRCQAVGAAIAWPQKLDGHTFRRLQLAAEETGTNGLLIRPEAARQEPSWADLRLWVEPLPSQSPHRNRRVRIEVLRCRGGATGRSVEVEVDEDHYLVRSASRRPRC